MAETNKVKFQNFIGPSNTLRVGRFDCQRTVNLFPELDPLATGKEKEAAVLMGTPGLRLVQSIGLGPVRAMWTPSNDSNLCFVVSGNEVYRLSGPLFTPITCTGNLSTSTGPVSITDNGIDVMLVDGQNGYYIPLAGVPVINNIIDPNFYPADVITFQDGYFILNQKGTQYYFISDLYSHDFLPLNLAAKAGNPDNIVSLISNNRELYLFGTKTTEVWYNLGQSGSTPFVRQDGKFNQFGCLAPHTLHKVNNTVFWLGTNADGGAVVFMLQNEQPVRVSNHAIEFALQQITNLTAATAYAYQDEGHYFYVLNCPGSQTTWVFDMSSQMWHERQSTINGITDRNLAECHTFMNNQHLVGDYISGNIYSMDMNYYTDNGEPIIRIRQTPHVTSSLNRVFYEMLELDMEFGVGLDSVGSGTTTSGSVQSVTIYGDPGHSLAPLGLICNTPPVVTFTGGGGSGATGHALLTGASAPYNLAGIVVDTGGSGYTSPPFVNVTWGAGDPQAPYIGIETELTMSTSSPTSLPDNQINPKVFLEISNDGGKTWGPPIEARMGKVGEYFTRARWQRLGTSRDRVFRVSTSDPVKVGILSSVLCIEVGYQ